jgi:prepilin-type N-terminal cleavage/methylation domain-containing protein
MKPVVPSACATPSGVSARGGFTLIELLTVIAIVGILTALLVPVVSTARLQARKATEVSAARQLIIGYHLAANDQRGRLMAAQEAGQSALGEGGQALGSIVAVRWPHRLRPYLGDRFRATLYVLEQGDYYDKYQADDYRLSLAPTFGLNGAFVGGGIGGLQRDPPITRLEQAAEPARLIAFAATRYRTLDPSAGFFYVNAPHIWAAPDTPRSNSEPGLDAAYGYLAPRWQDRATLAMLDGSVTVRLASELRDMRWWSDVARRRDDPNYRPPAAL